MEDQVSELRRRIGSDPGIKWPRGSGSQDLAKVASNSTADTSVHIADLFIDRQRAESRGMPTHLHDLAIDLAGRYYLEMTEICKELGLPTYHLVDATTISSGVRDLSEGRPAKPAPYDESPEERIEWPAYYALGKPELVAQARWILDETLEPFEYSGNDFDVIEHSYRAWLVFSGQVAMRLCLPNGERILSYSDFCSNKLKKRLTVPNLSGGNGTSTNLGAWTNANLYRGLHIGRPEGWPSFDPPELNTVTIMTDPMASLTTDKKRCRTAHVNDQGTVKVGEVGVEDRREEHGFRLVYPLGPMS